MHNLKRNFLLGGFATLVDAAFIAVPTGNGGGSPRNVPATIEPDVHSPATGNALYVFALPDRK